MAFVTKYGTVFGHAPLQTGRIHFVAPAASYTVDGRAYIASDDNDGLSPERALLTLSQALTNITASAGEAIYLFEGTHAQTATLRVQKAGITFIGQRSLSASEVGASAALGVFPKPIISFVGAAAPGVSIEADNIEISNVTLRPAPGFSTVIFRNSSPDNFYMHDYVIVFTRGQPALATIGIDFGYRADTAGLAGTAIGRNAQTTQRATAFLANFSIVSGGAYGPGILTATADVTVVGGRFHNRAGAWATAFAVATGTGYVFIKACDWTAQGTTGIGICLDGTNSHVNENSSSSKQFLSNKVAAYDCRFPFPWNPDSGSPVDNWPTGVISLVECYAGNNGNPALLPPTYKGIASVYQTVASA